MHPLQIDIADAGEGLRIRWQDEGISNIPARELRARCDCVECRSRRHGTGPSLIPLATEQGHRIREVHLVNSSTLLVIWKDGHDKSYYSFRTLREAFPPSTEHPTTEQ